MEAKQLQSLIEDYIKNNLRVEMDTDYSYSDSRQKVETTVFLGGDVVSSDYVYRDND